MKVAAVPSRIILIAALATLAPQVNGLARAAEHPLTLEEAIARLIRSTSENWSSREPVGSLSDALPPVSGAGSASSTALATGAGGSSPRRVP